MAQVEMKFSAHSAKHNAKPGDVKKVDARDAARLEVGGIAEPTSNKEAEKAKQ